MSCTSTAASSTAFRSSPEQVLLGLREQLLLGIREPVVHDARDLGQTGELGCAPPPLAGDDPVAPGLGLEGRDDDGLAETGPLQARGKMLERRRVQVLCR
jgi:hypothetical protein